MSEIAAAMGLTLLDELDALIERNRQNYHLYRAQLQDVAQCSQAQQIFRRGRRHAAAL